MERVSASRVNAALGLVNLFCFARVIFCITIFDNWKVVISVCWYFEPIYHYRTPHDQILWLMVLQLNGR